MRALLVIAAVCAVTSCSSERGRLCAEREALFETCDADGFTFFGCPCGDRIVETCHPDDTTSCYTGPEGTENVGSCKAGQSRCIADGTRRAGCEGQVFPTLDVCSTRVDESCGKQSKCIDDSAWGRAFGTMPAVNAPIRVRSDSEGNVYLLGGDVGLPHASPEPTAIFKYDTKGALESLRGDSVYDMAVAPGGRIAMLYVQGATPSCPPKGSNSATVAVIDAKGTCVWSRGIVDANNQSHVVWSGDGDLVMARAAELAIDRRRGSDGALIWESIAVGAGATIQNLAVDGAGNIYASGSYTTSVDFGTGPVTTTAGGAVYLVKFAPDGRVLFLKSFEGMTPLRMSVATDGNVAFAGVLAASTEVSFGGDSLQAGTTTALVVALLDANGERTFARIFDSKNDVFSSAVPAFNAQGDVVVATSFTGRVDFGGIPLAGIAMSTTPDALGVIALDSQGSARWAMSYLSDGGPVVVNDLTIAPSGAPLVAGTFVTSLTLSWGILPAPPSGTGFLAKIAP